MDGDIPLRRHEKALLIISTSQEGRGLACSGGVPGRVKPFATVVLLQHRSKRIGPAFELAGGATLRSRLAA